MREKKNSNLQLKPNFMDGILNNKLTSQFSESRRIKTIFNKDIANNLTIRLKIRK